MKDLHHILKDVIGTGNFLRCTNNDRGYFPGTYRNLLIQKNQNNLAKFDDDNFHETLKKINKLVSHYKTDNMHVNCTNAEAVLLGTGTFITIGIKTEQAEKWIKLDNALKALSDISANQPLDLNSLQSTNPSELNTIYNITKKFSNKELNLLCSEQEVAFLKQLNAITKVANQTVTTVTLAALSASLEK